LTKIMRKAPCSDCWLAEFDRKMARKHAELGCKPPQGYIMKKSGEEQRIKKGQPAQAKTFNVLPSYEYKGGLEFDREKGYCVDKEGNRVLLPKIFPTLPG
jgi:hypothetical protein